MLARLLGRGKSPPKNKPVKKKVVFNGGPFDGEKGTMVIEQPGRAFLDRRLALGKKQYILTDEGFAVYSLERGFFGTYYYKFERMDEEDAS